MLQISNNELNELKALTFGVVTGEVVVFEANTNFSKKQQEVLHKELVRRWNSWRDLYEACKYTVEQIKTIKGKAFPILPILNAITKAESEE